jgi:hypothetical protein
VKSAVRREKLFDLAGQMRLSWHEFANAACCCITEEPVMPRLDMMIASLQTQTVSGQGGLGCAIDGGLGTISMITTTTSWTWGAAGVR